MLQGWIVMFQDFLVHVNMLPQTSGQYDWTQQRRPPWIGLELSMGLHAWVGSMCMYGWLNIWVNQSHSFGSRFVIVVAVYLVDVLKGILGSWTVPCCWFPMNIVNIVFIFMIIDSHFSQRCAECRENFHKMEKFVGFICCTGVVVYCHINLFPF